MNMKRIVLLAVIAALTLISMTACANSSEDETETDGSLCYLPRPRDSTSDFMKVADNNECWTDSDVGDWTGTFSGTSEGYSLIIYNNSGRMSYISISVFVTVDVDGASGGLEIIQSGEKPDRVSDWKGEWVIANGTGALENLRGHGTLWGPGWQGNYSDCGVVQYSVEDLEYFSE